MNFDESKADWIPTINLLYQHCYVKAYIPEDLKEDYLNDEWRNTLHAVEGYLKATGEAGFNRAETFEVCKEMIWKCKEEKKGCPMEIFSGDDFRPDVEEYLEPVDR